MKRNNIFTGLVIITIVLFLVSIFAVFIYAPVDMQKTIVIGKNGKPVIDSATNKPLEKGQPNIIQKIFYFHVPSAWVGMLAFLVVFIASMLYLRTNDESWYIRSRSAAEIGVIFTTIVLITGPIWGRIAWNSWWNWYDLKLDSALIMWLLYLGFILIGSNIEEIDKRARFQSVYGIVAFLDVPIVIMSVRWWQTAAGTHPIVVKSGGLPGPMIATLMVSLAAFTFLFATLMMLRTDVERAELDLEQLQEDRRA